MITDQFTTEPSPSLISSHVAPEEKELVISVRNIGKMYRIYEQPIDRLKQMLLWRFRREYGRSFWALRNLSFDIRRGETVGVIGRNGSGKSTLLQMIAGTLTPTEGEIYVKGRIAALLELGSGFNPEFTGRENVFMNGAILGLSRSEMAARFDEISAFADIGEFIEQPVKIYSSGMVVRLAFAVAACVSPDILIVDEALAVGDISFQARCLDKIKQLTQAGTTTLFVTHDTGTFQNLCDYGYLLDQGCLFSHGRPAHVAMQYYELMRESEHTRQRLSASTQQHSKQVLAEQNKQAERIQQKNDAGEYRFGTGAANIIDYRILNSSGKEVASLQVGELCKFEVTIAFSDHVANIALGIMFRNAQGQNLMGMHSYVEHRVDFGAHEAGEQLTICCEQKMLLNPGDYLLSLGLADCRSDYDFTSLDNRNSIAKISIYGKPLGYGLIHTTPRFFLSDALDEQVPEQQTWQSMHWKDWEDWIIERCQSLAPHARRVLEIGGEGKELASFLEEQAPLFEKLNFPDADICRPTPYNDGSFDLIVSKMTFEHLYDPFAASKEISRLLAPGGILLLATVWSWRYHSGPGFDDYWRFSTAGLRQLFHRLDIIETGYDIVDRRKDCRLDNVPVDGLGGWREHWYVFLVARKPLQISTQQNEIFPYSYAANLLDYDLATVKMTYESVLNSLLLSPVLQTILALQPENIHSTLLANGSEEERALPSEPKFVQSGYTRMMLGRYAFAASQFCRGADVLDTCCGLGWGAYLTAQFAQQVTAFDINPALAAFSTQTWPATNIEWLSGSTLDLSFLNGKKYNVVLGMETIEHFSAADGEVYIQQIVSVLHAGGVFIGTSAFPDTAEEARVLEQENPYHLHIHTQQEMRKLLERYFSRATIIGNWMFIAVK